MLDLIKDHQAQEEVARKAYHDKLEEIAKAASSIVDTASNDVIPALLSSHVLSGSLSAETGNDSKATPSKVSGDQNKP